MHYFKYLVLMPLAAALLSGCPETASCADGQSYDPDAPGCVESMDDGGPMDAAEDTGDFCDTCAEGEFCDRDNAECDECDPLASPSTCAEPTPVCSVTGACVECTSDTDCDSPSASRCEANTCVRCTDSLECGHVMAGATNLGVCDLARDGGECVECTEATEVIDCAGAGTNIGCDRTAGRCAPTPRSADVCEPCSHDYECLRGRRCVEMTFAGAPVGSFCLLVQTVDQDCGDEEAAFRPYSVPTIVTSVDGATDTVCSLGSGITCAALDDFNSTSCTTNENCGLPDVADGFCPTTGTRRCSYRCSGAVDCRDTTTCGGATSHCLIP